MRLFFSGLLVLFLIAAQGAARAQTPVITTEFSEDSVTVGQPFVLRLTVLVPTYMPKPPIFPTFEAENIIVRLPERSSSPTSKTIDGETWSGITRSYQMYPMEAGTTSIPAQNITLFYMSPDTNEEIVFEGVTPAFSLKTTLPAGAEGLDPPIIAQSLTAEQTLTPQEGPIEIGDSIERNLMISIQGTSPLFIPPVIGLDDIGGLATYPQDPKVTESSDRGLISGTREERVVYIAQAAGAFTLPDLTLSWFNLSTEAVETITLSGLTTEVTQPTALERSLDKSLILTLAIVVFLVILLWVVWKRFAGPQLRKIIQRLVSNYNDTPHAAYQNAIQVSRKRDLAALFTAVEAIGTQDDSLKQLMRNLTHSMYGADSATKSEVDHCWSEVTQDLRKKKPRVSILAVFGIKASQEQRLGRGFGNQGY